MNTYKFAFLKRTCSASNCLNVRLYSIRALLIILTVYTSCMRVAYDKSILCLSAFMCTQRTCVDMHSLAHKYKNTHYIHTHTQTDAVHLHLQVLIRTMHVLSTCRPRVIHTCIPLSLCHDNVSMNSFALTYPKIYPELLDEFAG
jgi:hypothetical protein